MGRFLVKALRLFFAMARGAKEVGSKLTSSALLSRKP